MPCIDARLGAGDNENLEDRCLRYATREGWEFKIASLQEVEPAVLNLSGHMSEPQREVFRDKLLRYVRKPDRDLILAVKDGQIFGFNCVIDHDEVPARLSAAIAERLRTFACGNGLMVHPDHRRRGLGVNLQRRVELWAQRRNKAGFWLITHRQAQWYCNHLGYEEVGRVMVKGIERRVLAKTFPVPCQDLAQNR